MAYTDATQSNSQRTGAIVAVGAIHAVIGVGLLMGLSTTVTKWIDPPLEATLVPLPQPTEEPPEPAPRAEPDAQIPAPPIPAPPRPFEFDNSNFQVPETPTFDNGPLIELPGPTGTPTAAPAPAPAPAPTATFKPVSPKPRNNPGTWVQPSDYPSPDLRQENEGTTGFRVVVGSDGRVNACEITASSGHPRLDDATCKQVTRRARFEPARDGKGERVVGTYSSQVRWVIPR
jgi:protein TonB